MPGIAVIVGAGASHDCADSSTGQINGDFKPPLANQLFENRGRFNQILNQYPGARALSARIRSELAPQTKGLEDILRDIEGDKDVYTRRQYVEVPPYLQELLGDVSHAFIIAGGNYYDTLVADIQHSRYEHFLYITVNYDLFLDRALTGFYYDHPLNDVADYCASGSKWALVKLHGSVNWGRRALNATLNQRDAQFSLALSGDLTLDSRIVLLPGYKGGGRVVSDQFYYPSMAPPIGAKELACPPQHLDAMTSRLRDCSALLLIGFSALDSHVLEMFRLCDKAKTVRFVNESADAGRRALHRCQPHNACFNNLVPDDVIYGLGFARFVRDGRLRDFLRSVA